QGTFRSQHAKQPIRPLAAKDPDGQVERHVLLVRSRNRDVSDADLGLRRSGAIDDDEPARGWRRIDRLQRRDLALLPAAERLLCGGKGFLGLEIADDGEKRVVGYEPGAV